MVAMIFPRPNFFLGISSGKLPDGAAEPAEASSSETTIGGGGVISDPSIAGTGIFSIGGATGGISATGGTVRVCGSTGFWSAIVF
jgi:hypothetical protein